jgi:hypothetical protein
MFQYWCRPLDYADFDKLFDPAAIHHEVYCEGFPKHFVHGSFNDYLPKAEESYARREFTIEIHSKYDVYTFFYVLYHRYIKPGKAWYNEKNKDKE